MEICIVSHRPLENPSLQNRYVHEKIPPIDGCSHAQNTNHEDIYSHQFPCSVQRCFDLRFHPHHKTDSSTEEFFRLRYDTDEGCAPRKKAGLICCSWFTMRSALGFHENTCGTFAQCSSSSISGCAVRCGSMLLQCRGSYTPSFSFLRSSFHMAEVFLESWRLHHLCPCHMFDFPLFSYPRCTGHHIQGLRFCFYFLKRLRYFLQVLCSLRSNRTFSASYISNKHRAFDNDFCILRGLHF